MTPMIFFRGRLFEVEDLKILMAIPDEARKRVQDETVNFATEMALRSAAACGALKEVPLPGKHSSLTELSGLAAQVAAGGKLL